MMKRMCDLYADGNLRFIVKKRCPEDVSFFRPGTYGQKIT